MPQPSKTMEREELLRSLTLRVESASRMFLPPNEEAGLVSRLSFAGARLDSESQATMAVSRWVAGAARAECAALFLHC